MLVYVINLDSSTERFQRISSQLTKLNIKFQRISAINGRTLDENFVKTITYPTDHFETKVRFTRNLTKAEIGCFLSHKHCWDLLLKSNEKWALILEDDITISPHASKYMTSDDWLPDDVKLCQLNIPCKEKRGRIGLWSRTIDKDITLVAPLYPTPLGAFAYFISREVAKEAISLSDKISAPVDDFLFSPWFSIVHQFKVWKTSPALVIPAAGVNSDIGDRSKKNIKKAPFFIRHGFRRFLLNTEVKKYQSNGQEFIFRFWD